MRASSGRFYLRIVVPMVDDRVVVHLVRPGDPIVSRGARERDTGYAVCVHSSGTRVCTGSASTRKVVVLVRASSSSSISTVAVSARAGAAGFASRIFPLARRPAAETSLPRPHFEREGSQAAAGGERGYNNSRPS